MSDESETDIEYHNKLKKLDLPESLINILSKKYIDTLYEYHIEHKSLIIDENMEKKKKIVMKILNKMLKLSDKEPIDDIKKFKLLRSEIINEKCQEYLESKYDDIFKLFDKKKHRFYFRNRIDNYILTFLRSSIKEIGYNLNHYQMTCNKTNDGKKTHRFITFYRIN